jgi:hypothetical protein
MASFSGCCCLYFKWNPSQSGIFFSRFCLAHWMWSKFLSANPFLPRKPREGWQTSQVLLTAWADIYSQLFHFLEEYDIKTQVSAVVQRKYRTSKPEPRTREQFLQCKLWMASPPPVANVRECFLKQEAPYLAEDSGCHSLLSSSKWHTFTFLIKTFLSEVI